MTKSAHRGLGLVVAFALPLAAWGCGGNGLPGDRAQSGGPPSTEASARQERGPNARPGQIMPTFVQERLELTTKQKEQVEDLQKQADRKLRQILTLEQKKQLEEMQQGLGRGGAGSFGRRRPESDE